MRVLDGEQTLARIFFGESEKWHHQPLARALLDRLHKEGFAGATVMRGVAGFGADSVIHTASIIDLSGDLPMLIEVVDDDEHMQKLPAILDEMLTGGALVTLEKVRVLRYAGSAGNRPGRP
jgi:PII-like signaling protein